MTVILPRRVRSLTPEQQDDVSYHLANARLQRACNAAWERAAEAGDLPTMREITELAGIFEGDGDGD